MNVAIFMRHFYIMMYDVQRANSRILPRVFEIYHRVNNVFLLLHWSIQKRGLKTLHKFKAPERLETIKVDPFVKRKMKIFKKKLRFSITTV